MAMALVRRAAAAAPPRAPFSIYHSNGVSRFTGITRTAAPPLAASSSAGALSAAATSCSDLARIAGLTTPTAPPRAPSSIHLAHMAGITRSAASPSARALFAGLTSSAGTIFAVLNTDAATSSSPPPLFAGLNRATATSSSAGALFAGLNIAAASSSRDTGLTTAAARFRAPAGLLIGAPARSSGILSRGSTHRGTHSLARRPMDPHILLALRRLDYEGFQRQKEVANGIEKLRAALMKEENDILLFLTDQVFRIGTISWRVSTTVLGVAVAAGFGVLQLVKSDWEEESDKSTSSLITSRLAHTKSEFDEFLTSHIAHRRSVAAAIAFLENEKIKERTGKLEEREAVLAAKEAVLAAKEAVLAANEAVPVKMVSRWSCFFS